jgi:hypothetical protein
VNSGASVGTNQSGADLTLKAGVATGTGSGGNVRQQASFTSTTSGSTAQTLYDRFTIAGHTLSLSTTSNTTTTFATATAAVSNSAVGCTVSYLIEAIQGSTAVNSVQGMVTFIANNTNGTVATVAAPTAFGTTPLIGSGSLTIAFAATVSGTTMNMRVTPSWGTIVPTVVRITYQILSNGQTTISPV